MKRVHDGTQLPNPHPQQRASPFETPATTELGQRETLAPDMLLPKSPPCLAPTVVTELKLSVRSHGALFDHQDQGRPQEYARSIAIRLAKLPSLTRLSLEIERMDEQEVVAIAAGVQAHAGFEHLQLHMNQSLTPETAGAWFDAFKSNTNLKSVDFGQFGVVAGAQKLLRDFLESTDLEFHGDILGNSYRDYDHDYEDEAFTWLLLDIHRELPVLAIQAEHALYLHLGKQADSIPADVISFMLYTFKHSLLGKQALQSLARCVRDDRASASEGQTRPLGSRNLLFGAGDIASVSPAPALSAPVEKGFGARLLAVAATGLQAVSSSLRAWLGGGGREPAPYLEPTLSSRMEQFEGFTVNIPSHSVSPPTIQTQAAAACAQDEAN